MQRFTPIKKRLGAVADYFGVAIDTSDSEIEITGLSSNSKSIDAGEIFIALPGAKTHGSAFIQTAVERGARAVITDNSGANPLQHLEIPVLVVPNPRSQIGFLSDWFFDSPSRSMYVAGITGTNGKTTTTYLLNQIWQFADFLNGLIGTVGIKIGEDFYPTTHTTPESDVVHRILSVMQEQHIRAVAMEASSHALVQHRVDGVHFSVAGFTNLSQDHLDFHGDMESYFQAKRRLFTGEISDFAFINIDNEYGVRLAKEISIPLGTLSMHNKKATWYFESIESDGKGHEVVIRGEGGQLIEGHINLLGSYNLENCLLAVAIAAHSGVDPLVIGQSLSTLTGAPGRLERIANGQEFTALVDFAHSPDAVSKVLKTAREITKSRLIGILGCGGDRDKTKRPLMGKALYEGCDVAIFTSDNPRNEDPASILEEMTVGLSLGENQKVIVERAAAIEYATRIAKPGDTVIVLGKGHETGQEINGVKTPFSDQAELRKAIANLK
ncbi:MAG: UDP-N-acetylmuramoyl-L-alanyl-D-glutamate--2,6-diaminopimelate ligase [Candidatus Nanopelagicaceae bacterium]|nr:UDP-N-acetylmuramoyl-L-alanyl-D-glutamate--2,6-diaminopimelate ligase [Candidatus Nanopelagicaceae bacterium]